MLAMLVLFGWRTAPPAATDAFSIATAVQGQGLSVLVTSASGHRGTLFGTAFANRMYSCAWVCVVSLLLFLVAGCWVGVL